MNVHFMASALAVVAAAACGGKKDESTGGGGATASAGGGSAGAAPAGGAKGKWLGAALKPVEVEVGDVKVKVEVPDGLPANDEYLLGKDWWVGVGVDITQGSFPGGPRLTLDKPREKAFADPEALARDVEPDAKRPDLIEIAKEALPGGRVRYVSATKGNRHLDVTVWIPLASEPAKGVRCNAHWYAGSGETPANPPPPDAAIIDWLEKFCDSAQVIEAAAAPPPPPTQ